MRLTRPSRQRLVGKSSASKSSIPVTSYNLLIFLLIIACLMHPPTSRASAPKSSQQKTLDSGANAKTESHKPQTSTSLKDQQHLHHPLDNIEHNEENHDPGFDDIPEHKKKEFVEKIKQSLLKIMGLTEAPKPKHTQQAHNKVFVPRAILEEYRRMRESVREVVPSDKDFYGKINIDDLDHEHHDFWGAIHNKYGSYDILVDMGANDGVENNERFRFHGDAKHIAYIGSQDEPENIPPKLEHSLPPHSRIVEKSKKFVSVHLKFNISKDFIDDETSAERLKGAELRLSREQYCEHEACDRKSVPFPDKTKNNQRPESKRTNLTSTNTYPRYQRVYVIRILGYDSHDEPIALIYDSRRIDTRDTSPLIFDIYEIVNYWLRHPDKNYGIIIRVANDDPAYESTATSDKSHSDQNVPNASQKRSLTNNGQEQQQQQQRQREAEVLEHLRLKRDFRLTSESKDSWLQKKPAIIIYTDPPDTTRRHVKRDYMSATEPSHDDATTPTTNSQRHIADQTIATGNSATTIMSTAASTVAAYNTVTMTSTTAQDYSTTEHLHTTTSSQDMLQNSATHKTTTTTTTTTADLPAINTPTVSATSATPIARPHMPYTTARDRSVIDRRDNVRSNTRSWPSRPHHSGGSGASGSGGGGGGSGGGSGLGNGHHGQAPRPKGKGKLSSLGNKCSKRTMSINFDEVGWSSWIIAPQSYTADYCAGDCSFPMDDNQNATNHAIIQSIFHSVGRVVPRSCCAPTKLSSVALLYQLDGSVQVKKYDDMIVESCGCL